jgi:hypothetical protein
MSNPMNYKRHERLTLKGHPQLTERWVQDRIAEDPTIIGLGEVELVARERQQERAGRLDLLLTDADDTARYELELMLGPTDESHIIRCIEYWDIERRRYPGYEHCAVIVAEDITSRFLNVLSLLSGTVPLVAIQLNALQVDGHVLLHFAKVLDQRALRRDDTVEAERAPSDRSYWLERSSQGVVEAADAILDIINRKSPQRYQLNYNRHYIGLSDGLRSRNFIHFRPRRKHLQVVLQPGWSADMVERLDEAGLATDQNHGRLVYNLTPSDLKKHVDLVTAITHEMVARQAE